MEHRGMRARDWAALGGCIGLAIFVVTSRPVPLLAYADLGFHELGHLLTMPLPELITAAAGSVFQVAVPLGLATYFALARHDRVGAGVCLAWAGTSTRNVAVYVADAPYERLQLIGGDHDWAFILHKLDTMDAAAPLAAVVVTAAWALAACAIIVVAAPAGASLLGPRETGPAWESPS